VKVMRTRSHHELSCWLTKLDFADGVRECRVFLARTAWLAVLAQLGLLKGDLFPVGVAVNIDVCLAHRVGCVGSEPERMCCVGVGWVMGWYADVFRS
jgi:hypothetical protein